MGVAVVEAGNDERLDQELCSGRKINFLPHLPLASDLSKICRPKVFFTGQIKKSCLI